MTPLIVRPAAEADIENAFQWYEQQRAGLGAEFRGALRTAFDSITANPLLFSVIYRNTRRYLVRRFPYAIYYRVYPNQIVVVACMHGRRNPRQWQTRV